MTDDERAILQDWLNELENNVNSFRNNITDLKEQNKTLITRIKFLKNSELNFSELEAWQTQVAQNAKSIEDQSKLLEETERVIEALRSNKVEKTQMEKHKERIVKERSHIKLD
jgi:chromosome segregation ATPase